MLTEVEPMKQETAVNGGREMRGHFVLGYSPVLISTGAKQMLNDFRENKIPVDLRIERSMVSAAIELTMTDGELKEELVRQSKVLLQEEHRNVRRVKGEMIPGYGPVLIKDGIKQQLRYFGTRHGISTDMYELERILASVAIAILLRTERLHDKWVELIQSMVGWEVGHAYRSAKIG
jgi:hypothetical protein